MDVLNLMLQAGIALVQLLLLVQLGLLVLLLQLLKLLLYLAVIFVTLSPLYWLRRWRQRPKLKRGLVTLLALLLLAVPALAQEATPEAPVPLAVPVNALISNVNQWSGAFIPVFSLEGGLIIALAVLLGISGILLVGLRQALEG